jgi:AcrR family transcriptional regulator
MSPVDRRRAIVEAVVPLLIEQGAMVTTRQMAAAAGIAEGTIFRVFPDKSALIHEAIKATMDPAPVQRELAAIDPSCTFEEQVRVATVSLLKRLEAIVAVMTVMRTMPSEGRRTRAPSPHVAEAHREILRSLVDLFERHRSELRIDPRRAAVVLQGLVFATGHPGITRADKLTDEDIVSVLLSGITKRRVAD